MYARPDDYSGYARDEIEWNREIGGVEKNKCTSWWEKKKKNGTFVYLHVTRVWRSEKRTAYSTDVMVKHNVYNIFVQCSSKFEKN